MDAAIEDPALRLRALDWSGLDGLGPMVCAAAVPVLGGASVERALDRLLRDHRELSSPQRTCVVEALFGLALWRRRLAAHAGLPWDDLTNFVTLSTHAPGMLSTLLRDLASLPEARAVELAGCPSAPPRFEALKPAECYSLPDWLWVHFSEELPSPGHLEAQQLAAALCLPGPIFLRANRLRATREELRARLAREGIESEPCRYAADGLRVLAPRPNLLASQAFRQGLFEAQDEGSQLLGELLEANPGEQILDLCAGAGGKSLQLAAAVGAGGRVFCHDIDRGRLGRLRQRAERAGATCIEVIDSLPEDLQVHRVLVDAPCSELGTLRRGPDARFRIDRASLGTLPALQLSLLETAARHLRPGGRLVYATCTIRRAENEEVAIAFERAQSGFARIRPCDGKLGASFFRDDFFRALPHRHGTDGFFAAAWKRA